eukprot:c7099_g1_i1.p1 GENE.c7099_g1_i1~~c7099_g1_i1.p1  ORF type:complete len:208 (-),score=25.89 c7099_g1_i1:31-654(-)
MTTTVETSTTTLLPNLIIHGVDLATRILRVSSQSDSKSVAGSIAHISRAGEPPVVTAVGANSSNQAIKAVAIARNYLVQDEIDVGCLVQIVKDEEITHNLQLTIVKRARREPAENLEAFELKVKRESDPAKTAGAIAGKAREGVRVSVTCATFGAETVYCAIESIAIARQYLAKDGLDITAYPSFLSVQLDDGMRTAIRFELLISQI